MKRMIASLAALALITSVPVTALFPAVQTSSITASAADVLSVSQLAGKWRAETGEKNYTADVCAKNAGVLVINADGTGSYTLPGLKTFEGKVSTGIEAGPDGVDVPFVKFSQTDGDLELTGYYKNTDNEEIISIGNGGMSRLVRSKPVDGAPEEYIEQKMADLTLILGAFAGTIPCDTTQTIKVGDTEYGKITDMSKIGSLEEFKTLIGSTCTGDLKKQFLSRFEDYFVEKDGNIFRQTVNLGHVIFDTSGGIIISDKTADSFRATTVKRNEMNGHAQAVFSKDDGKWLISDYGSGTFSANTSVDDRIDAAYTAVTSLGMILPELAKGGPEGAETIVVDDVEYIKSEDQLLSPEKIKELIKGCATGDLRDSLIRECDGYYLVRDGVLYNRNTPHGFNDFNLNTGLELLSADAGSFKVVTNSHSDLDGYGIFELKADEGKWLISSYSLSPFPQERLFGGYVSVDEGDLNLRSEANTSSKILAEIPNGTQLDIYESGTEKWYMTVFNGQTGYVSADFIKEIPSGEKPAPGDLTRDGTVDSSDASEVLAVYAKGATGGTVTDETKSIGDINKDGLVDSSDASLILEYYAYVSTGGAETPATYFAKKS